MPSTRDSHGPFYLLEDLLDGGDGRVWLAFDSDGRVIKFPYLDKEEGYDRDITQDITRLEEDRWIYSASTMSLLSR